MEDKTVWIVTSWDEYNSTEGWPYTEGVFDTKEEALACCKEVGDVCAIHPIELNVHVSGKRTSWPGSRYVWPGGKETDIELGQQDRKPQPERRPDGQRQTEEEKGVDRGD